MSKHDPSVPLRHMLDYSHEALGLVQGKSRADLDSERLLDLGLMHLISLIGEAASRVSVEQRTHYPEIPWKEIVGMRQRLIHGYDNVDYDILWKTITEDLPSLIQALEKILR